MKTSSILAAALAFALTAAAAQGSVLVNGDFEGVAAPYGLPAGWDASTALNGGLFDKPNVFVAAGADYIPCCGASGSPAALANRFVTFGAGDTTHDGGLLAQTFATVLGQTYVVRFDLAAFGIGGTQTLNVAIHDLTHASLTASHDVSASSNNNLDLAFGGHQFAFTATGDTARLAFANISAQTGSIDAALDNVGVSAVPEPAAWTLMITGFAVLGLAARRRRVPAVG